MGIQSLQAIKPCFITVLDSLSFCALHNIKQLRLHVLNKPSCLTVRFPERFDLTEMRTRFEGDSIRSMGYGVFRENMTTNIRDCFNECNFWIHVFLPIQLNQCREMKDAHKWNESDSFTGIEVRTNPLFAL
jgi:hypothetical protein